MAFFEIAEAGENLAHEPGDGRLSRAGIAEEHAMQGGRRSHEPMTAARAVGFQHIDQLAHFRFHIGEADERVEFGKNIRQRPDSRRALSVRRSEPTRGRPWLQPATTASRQRRRSPSRRRRHRPETAAADRRGGQEQSRGRTRPRASVRPRRPRSCADRGFMKPARLDLSAHVRPAKINRPAAAQGLGARAGRRRLRRRGRPGAVRPGLIKARRISERFSLRPEELEA